MTAWQLGGKIFITESNSGAVSRNETPAGRAVFLFCLGSSVSLSLPVPSKRRNDPAVKINAANGSNYGICVIWAWTVPRCLSEGWSSNNNLDLSKNNNNNNNNGSVCCPETNHKSTILNAMVGTVDPLAHTGRSASCRLKLMSLEVADHQLRNEHDNLSTSTKTLMSWQTYIKTGNSICG